MTTVPKSRYVPEALSAIRQRGFTLIEVLVIIIILGILATAAFPSFRTLLQSQRIRSASFDIMATLTLARSEAIKRNAQVVIVPAGNDWTQGWSVVAPGGTVITQTAAMPGGITVACFSPPPTQVVCSQITYGSDGHIAVGSAPFIQISSQDTTNINTRCLRIDLSGRPNSKKGAC